MPFPARTPEPPYYAVVFTSVRSAADGDGYGEMAERMEALAAAQPGFLGIESARDAEGQGITVSYWDSLEAVRRWGADAEHRAAQAHGRDRWYRMFRIRVCRVERDDFFERPG
jgi:heme-degrading monooxygenase HmoA